jgi:hypothetical protein
MNEEFDFDKFMQDILQREETQHQKIKHYAENHADSPARQYNAKYREHTHNRIRYDRGDQ